MRTLTRVAMAVAFAGVVACGGDGPTGLQDIAGTYTLTAVDGQPLPKAVSIQSETGPTTITRIDGGLLTLSASGGAQTSRVDVMLRDSPTGTPYPAFMESSGTYTRDGNTLTIQILNASRPATFSRVDGEGTITVNVGGGFGTFTFTETP
jgi:hypothetical protein